MTQVALDCCHAKKEEEEKKWGYNKELESWKEWRRRPARKLAFAEERREEKNFFAEEKTECFRRGKKLFMFLNEGQN